MVYSLLNVSLQVGNRVDGNWIQDHIGTLESATEMARKTEQANSNKIVVAD